ncbi:MAG: hypothetical protein CMF49_00335 [Legionellales bacterium]|nr:hypothetical protein [Legionellales bacterium]
MDNINAAKQNRIEIAKLFQQKILFDDIKVQNLIQNFISQAKRIYGVKDTDLHYIVDIYQHKTYEDALRKILNENSFIKFYQDAIKNFLENNTQQLITRI